MISITEIASELKDGIAEADHATRRDAFEQLDLQCQVNQCGDDYNAAVTCRFSVMPEQKGVVYRYQPPSQE